MKNLNEELNRMQGLMSFDISQNSHDVLSEQLFDKDRRKFRKAKRKSKKSKGDGTITINSSQANWSGENTGTAYLTQQAKGYPAAYNIGNNKGMLWSMVMNVFDVKPTKFDPPPYTAYTEDPGYVIDDFNVGEIFDVYSDNMVMPRLENANVLNEFNEIVNQFVRYIKSGGLDKLNNVTIQGQADAANPTWDIPSSYQKLDHIYGGIKKKNQSEYTDDELDQMNTFLAKERAFNFKMSLINAIKEKTGKKIEIKELTPINHRGQEGKRGGKYRSILLKANAPLHKVVLTDPVKKKEYEDMIEKRKEYEKQVKVGLYPSTVAFNLNGKYVYMMGVNVYDTTQGQQEIVDVYTNIEPGAGNRYTETKVFVRAGLVEKYNFGKSDSDIILKNIKCTQEEIVINGGRGNVTLKGIKGNMGGADSIYSTFMNNGNVGGRTQFFNYKARDPALFYNSPLTFTTGETKKINGFLYFRVKNQWFAYTTSKRSADLNKPTKEITSVIDIRNREDN